MRVTSSNKDDSADISTNQHPQPYLPKIQETMATHKKPKNPYEKRQDPSTNKGKAYAKDVIDN